MSSCAPGAFNQIQLIDTETDPRYLAYSPITSANTVFVAVPNYGSKTVSVYSVNVSDGNLTQVASSPFTTGTNPTTVAFTQLPSSGTLFAAVTNFNSFSISGYTVNTATGAFTSVTPGATGGAPFGLAFSPIYGSNLFAVVANATGNSLSIFPVSAAGFGSPTTVTDNFNGPRGVAFSSVFDTDLALLVVANAADNNLIAYTMNLTNGALTVVSGSPFSVGASPYAVAISPQLPSGNFLVAAANLGGDTVSVFSFDPTTATLTSTGQSITGLEGPNGIAFSPLLPPGSGASLLAAVTNYQSSTSGTGSVTVYTVNISSGIFTEVTGSPFGTPEVQPYGVAFSPLLINDQLYAASTNQSSSNLQVFAVTLLPTATIELPSSTPVPCGTSVTLTVNLTGAAPWTVVWSDNGVAQSPQIYSSSPATRSVTPTATTSYEITLVTDTDGCASQGPSNTVTVNVAVAAPMLLKSFVPNPAAPNTSVMLLITVGNPNPTCNLSNVHVLDPLAMGLTVPVPDDFTSNCVDLMNGSNVSTVQFVVPELTANAICDFAIAITAAAPGTYDNEVTATADESGSAVGNAYATLTVLEPLGVTKTFTPNAVPLGGLSTVTFALSNPNDANVGNIGFIDNISPLVVAMPNGVSDSCPTGTVTATPGSDLIVFSGGSLASGETCAIGVSVMAPETPGILVDYVTVDSDAGSTSASASLDVFTALPPTLLKSFVPSSAAPYAPVTLMFTVHNPNAADLHSVNLFDPLPTGLVANALSVTSNCASLLPINETTDSTVHIVLPVLPAGEVCDFAVAVTANSVGTYDNHVFATANESGPAMSNASATLTVQPTLLASKQFAPPGIAGGVPSTLTITLTNPNDTVAGNVTFSDVLPAGMYPVSSGHDTCNGLITIVPITDRYEIQYDNAAGVPGASNCVVTIDVTANAPGSYLNNVTVDVADPPATTNASAMLTVFEPLGVTKTFTPNAVPVGGTSTVTFVLSNPNMTTAVSDISFADSLSPLVVATPNGVVDDCGGTVTATPGTDTIVFSDGMLAAGGSCTINVQVEAPTMGTFVDYVTVYSSVGTSNTANAPITVFGPPMVSKSFSPPTTGPGVPVTLLISVSNPNDSNLSSVNVTDVLPTTPGMLVANVATAMPCPGATDGTTSSTVHFVVPTLGPHDFCNFSVDVSADTVGVYRNNVTATATESGDLKGNASATLTVTSVAPSPPTVTAVFSPSRVFFGQTSTLIVAITNDNVAQNLTDVMFADVLPRGLQAVGHASATCGTVMVDLLPSGLYEILYDNPSMPPSTTCTVTVPVAPTTVGLFTTTINVVSDAPNVAMATATLAVVTFPTPPPCHLGLSLEFHTPSGPQQPAAPFGECPGVDAYGSAIEFQSDPSRAQHPPHHRRRYRRGGRFLPW